MFISNLSIADRVAFKRRKLRHMQPKLTMRGVIIFLNLYANVPRAKRDTVTDDIYNASECIVELYKHAGIFKNTRELHKEARGAVLLALLEYF